MNVQKSSKASPCDQEWAQSWRASIPSKASPLQRAALLEQALGVRRGAVPRERLALLALDGAVWMEAVMMWANEAYSSMEAGAPGHGLMRSAAAYCVGLAIGAEASGQELAPRSGRNAQLLALRLGLDGPADEELFPEISAGLSRCGVGSAQIERWLSLIQTGDAATAMPSMLEYAQGLGAAMLAQDLSGRIGPACAKPRLGL